MPITEMEMNELLSCIGSKEERTIALAVFRIESVLREVISLIASHPEKLQNIGGPIKAIERVYADYSESEKADHEIFNIEVSVDETEAEQSADDPVTNDLIDVSDMPGINITEEPIEVTTITSTDDSGGVRVQIKSVAPLVEHFGASATPLSIHSPDHSNLYSCRHCERSFQRVFELQRHITVRHTDEKKFTCNECGQKFALRVYLNHHIRSKHQPHREKPYACPHCDYRCILQSLLNRHMEKHDQDKSFQCNVCGQYFYAYRYLERHMFRHQEKNLTCDFCDFRTADPYRLRSHMKAHTSTDEFNCEHCAFKTNLRSELNKHLLNLHPFIEYRCLDCPLVFKRPGNLKRHMFVHQEKNLQCSIENCGWRTADPYELKRHEKEHMDGKKHVCTVCGFRFHRAFDLKKHLRIHSKLHQCRHCPALFANAHELSCHRRRRHPKTISKDATADSGLPDAKDSFSHEETTTTVLSQQSGDMAGDATEINTEETTGTHTVVIDNDGGQIIIHHESGEDVSEQLEPTYITVPEVDQQLLEMASAIITQAGEESERAQANS